MASKHENEDAGTWRVKWRENGKPKSKNKKTEAEADAFIREVERRLEEGKPIMRRNDVPTLEEFTVKILKTWKGKVSPRTLALYAELLETHVLPDLGHLPLVDLRPSRLDRWQEDRLDAGAGPAVLGKAQAVLGRILRKAVLPAEYLDANPVDSLDKPGYKKKAQRWLTATEVEALRGWYLEQDDPGSATLISVLAYIGPRPQTALARTATDLVAGPPGWVRHAAEGSGRLLCTTKNVDGEIVDGDKTGDGKYWIYVPEPVRADLELWIPLSEPQTPDPDPRNLLWPHRKDGRPWTKTDWGNWSSRTPSKHHRTRPKCFKRACEEVGLGSSVTPYHLRHTAATLYAAAGWTYGETAKQLMHSPAVSASIYQHLFDERPPQAQKFSVEDFIREARGQLHVEREIVV